MNDRHTRPPPDDHAILPWYEGAFSHAFIALHPFFSVEGLDPATCNYGPSALAAEDRPDHLELIEWIDQQDAAQRRGKELDEDALDDIAKRFGRGILWKTLCREADFADHRQLDQALRTTILGLRAEYCDPAGAARLTTHCDSARIFPPTEGVFQPLMERGLVELFRRAGLDEIALGDEFGDEEHLVDVASLDMPGSWRASSLPLAFPRALYAADRSLLVTVHWDSFFTIILGTRQRLADARIGTLFEGFWASDETSIGWLFQPLIPLVE